MKKVICSISNKAIDLPAGDGGAENVAHIMGGLGLMLIIDAQQPVIGQYFRALMLESQGAFLQYGRVLAVGEIISSCKVRLEFPAISCIQLGGDLRGAADSTAIVIAVSPAFLDRLIRLSKR